MLNEVVSYIEQCLRPFFRWPSYLYPRHRTGLDSLSLVLLLLRSLYTYLLLFTLVLHDKRITTNKCRNIPSINFFSSSSSSSFLLFSCPPYLLYSIDYCCCGECSQEHSQVIPNLTRFLLNSGRRFAEKLILRCLRIIPGAEQSGSLDRDARLAEPFPRKPRALCRCVRVLPVSQPASVLWVYLHRTNLSSYNILHYR